MKKFNYPTFLRELEKEIDYTQGEVMKDYNRDIQFYRNAICQCNPNDLGALSGFSQELAKLTQMDMDFKGDKQYTLNFFKNPMAKQFVGYITDEPDIDLLYVMAMIKYFVDEVVIKQPLNACYWMVEDDEFFGKVIRRSFI